ncbi:DUF3533 domain-containing protein [Paenibacillus rhizovicinus]|uniref:DUF3533 domain-containing protein n=1 Tax=Paenibacillus rhizovicinus TaxID=2704463 RepID=A0A6C0P6D3_9BACL|nr:DUF3533 domain-containing protein [Paenibacillus rhizovicinus]QHW34079.1 DUF3533 domain-containing protein [Paenibacillus rhizovicinus]
MIHFFRQKHPYLTVVLVFVVVLVLGLAQLGSTVNPVPRNLPVLLVQQDAGAKTPAGDIDYGKLIADKLTASKAPNGGDNPLEWQTAESEEAAVDAMNHQKAYAALVIPADFSAKLASLLSPEPHSASVALYINQGMNYNGATMTSGILTQMINGASAQIRAEMLAAVDKQGGTLTAAQTAALAVPIDAAISNINAVGANSSNGNAPVVLTQLVWFGAMVSTMMLFIAANKATQTGSRRHRLGIRVSQIVMGAVATGAASLSILVIAGQWFGLDIPDYSSVGLFMFFAGFMFFLLQTMIVSWLGFAGVPLFVLVFFFGAPVLSLPSQLLPAFSHHFLYSWLPLRFSVEGLRDLFYFDGGPNLSEPSWTLAMIGIAGAGLILLSVLKKQAIAAPASNARAEDGSMTNAAASDGI